MIMTGTTHLTVMCWIADIILDRILLDKMKRIETSCWEDADWRDARDKCWCDVTVSLNCKCKLDLHLRLGYLKPFLAGSKKTRQGPVWRVGALCISRCWFYLTIVGSPKRIQKDYTILWCCVLLCCGSWWFKFLWYVNDVVEDVYEMIMKLVE